MKWSKDSPTETGYYWWREDANGKPQVVKVMKRTKGPKWVAVLSTHGRYGETPISLWACGEWMGPLKPEES